MVVEIRVLVTFWGAGETRRVSEAGNVLYLDLGRYYMGDYMYKHVQLRFVQFTICNFYLNSKRSPQLLCRDWSSGPDRQQRSQLGGCGEDGERGEEHTPGEASG